MGGPADPVDRSVASSGEIAAQPEDADDITITEVTDQHGNSAGLLIKWGDAEWMWAEPESYRELKQ